MSYPTRAILAVVAILAAFCAAGRAGAQGAVQESPSRERASSGSSDRENSSKRPGLAFLMSAILPGAGQIYNGDRRGYVYLGIEASAWFARFSYLDAGNKREGEYEAFARRHWAITRYRGSAGADGCIWTASDDSLLAWFLENDVQQYYEELGKYEKYRCGWDDFTYDPDNPSALSGSRKRYREMRQQSNDLLNNARLALAVAVVNRVVSGVDAFRSARKKSESVELRQGLHLENGVSGSLRKPRAYLKLVYDIP